MFKKRPELRFVGILPPLRTPHHPIQNKISKLREGEFREGIVISKKIDGFLVDIGIEKLLLTLGSAPSIGSRATVKIVRTRPKLLGSFARLRDVTEYWGYRVRLVGDDLETFLLNKQFDLKIATSKNGIYFKEIVQEIQRKWAEVTNVLVAMGAPKRGLKDILLMKKIRIEDVFDFCVNTIPLQGCETVRTEEAIHASLAIFNLFSC